MAGSAGAARADAAELRKRARRQLKEAMVARDSEDIEALRVAIEVAGEVKLDERDILRARELLAKLEAKDRPLALTDISRDDMEKLQAAASREEAVVVLMKCTGLSLQDGFQAEVLAEFHYHNFLFTQSHKLNIEQASTFMSLMKYLHSKAILEERMPEAAARELFEDLVRRHSRQLPPFSIAAFTEEQAVEIRAYADRGFFRHFAMYAHMYEQRPALSVRSIETRIAPSVLEPAALHKAFEVDPQEACLGHSLEVRNFLLDLKEVADESGLDPNASGSIGHMASYVATSRASGVATRGDGSFCPGASGATGSSARGTAARSDGTNSSLHVDAATKAEVEAVIDDVLQEMLPPLDERFVQLPD